ncbi:IS3 family transposase, partial [Salmonella enterica]|uniref:IS3 family transposase n=1 Tax=Salmonella enterica TaxID=28901 RepID=UPI0032B3C0E2
MSLIEPCYPGLSVRQQCALLDVNRSSLYYTPEETDQETLDLLRLIDEVYTKYPFFGTRQMVSYLERHYACHVGRSRVRRL